MNSLIDDIPAVCRRGNVAYAVELLIVFLGSAFATSIELQQKIQTLKTDRDELLTRQLSEQSIEDFAAFNASFDSDIDLKTKALDSHEEEFRSCAPKLENIIINVTGAGFPDTVEKFTADFTPAARGMDHRIDDLDMAHTGKFLASYATVRADGACLFRAFLTVMAYQLTGIVLAFDPKGMHDWIIRLKLLMCAHIQKTVQGNPQFERDLKSIPENDTVRTLAEYFVRFIDPTYHGTNYDCKILATMFGKPIHVIRATPEHGQTHETFLPDHAVVNAIAKYDIKLLYQPGHYNAIVKVFEWLLSPAVAPEF